MDPSMASAPASASAAAPKIEKRNKATSLAAKSGGSDAPITDGDRYRNNVYAFMFIAVCAFFLGLTTFRAAPIIFNPAQLIGDDFPDIQSNDDGTTTTTTTTTTAVDSQAAKASPLSPSMSFQRTWVDSDEEESEGPKKPLNILFLYADDWSFTSLGALGNDYIQTPRLDEMARNGTLFTHACVTTSICMVSRASMYTGQYAAKHRTYRSWKDLHMYDDDNWNYTVFPQLKQAGYYTGLFGKYHHTKPPKQIPTFDKYVSYQFGHYKTRDGVTKHITEWNEIDGMGFLKERPKDQPFALTVAFFATHAEDGSQEQYRPMNSSMWMYANSEVPRAKTFTHNHTFRMPHFISSSRNYGRGRSLKRYYPESKYQLMMKNTYRMASEVDAACGRLIDELERQGVLNETLVVFTTDNGNFHGQHGLAEKWYAYEESLRVPLIIMDPRLKKTKRGGKVSEFALNIDLAPTMLAAAKVDVPQQMQGRDLANLYLNPEEAKKSWRQEFFYEWIGDMTDLPSNNALVRKDKKYIQWPQWTTEQLFDLEADPYEEMDLNDEKYRNNANSAIMDEMRTRMLELQQLAIAGAKM